MITVLLSKGGLSAQVLDEAQRIAKTIDNCTAQQNEPQMPPGVGQQGGPCIPDQHRNERHRRIVDFNSDGKTDILWRYAQNGSKAIWQMNGFTRQSTRLIAGLPDRNWQVAH